MLYGVIELVGKLLKHTLGVLLLCWQRMLRFGLSVGVLSFVMVEVLGSALARQFPPDILTTVVALIVSFALGYAAALTALADELFLGAVDTIRILEGDTKAGLRAATAAAEREAGEAERGIMRWLGHSPSSASTPARSATSTLTSAPVAPRRSTSPEAAETLEAIAATEVFQSTAPRPRVNARPVRADQLPRIPWAYEQDGEATAPAQDETPPDAAGPELGSAPDMPPLPLRDAIAAASDEPASDVATGDAAGDDDDPAATLPAARKPATTAPVVAIDSDAAVTPASAAVESVESRDASSPSASSSPDASGNGDRSIWARIGQALVGNTMPLAALGGTHAAPPSGAPRPQPPAPTPEDADKEEPNSSA